MPSKGSINPTTLYGVSEMLNKNSFRSLLYYTRTSMCIYQVDQKSPILLKSQRALTAAMRNAFSTLGRGNAGPLPTHTGSWERSEDH